MNRASQLLHNAQEEQQTRENAVKMLEEAMEMRDLNRLTSAIEIAKKHNVPVRDAKKFQRKLEKGIFCNEMIINFKRRCVTRTTCSCCSKWRQIKSSRAYSSC
jgi:hypothetical protein